ncbi:MAG TPA: hypothetical protein DDX92_04230 [Flavobacteriales bacterium]|jgi:hypothetical protein|nr:hypothetical protein [Flavobacteriales bacterium]
MEEMDSIKFHCLECGQAILLTEVILNGTLSKHGYVRGICPNCGTIIPLFLEKEKDGVLIYLANQNWDSKWEKGSEHIVEIPGASVSSGSEKAFGDWLELRHRGAIYRFWSIGAQWFIRLLFENEQEYMFEFGVGFPYGLITLSKKDGLVRMKEKYEVPQVYSGLYEMLSRKLSDYLHFKIPIPKFEEGFIRS